MFCSLYSVGLRWLNIESCLCGLILKEKLIENRKNLCSQENIIPQDFLPHPRVGHIFFKKGYPIPIFFTNFGFSFFSFQG